jgi:hypothetical protein
LKEWIARFQEIKNCFGRVVRLIGPESAAGSPTHNNAKVVFIQMLHILVALKLQMLMYAFFIKNSLPLLKTSF